MKISNEHREFIKKSHVVLKEIISERMTDILNSVVDEEDPQKKEVLSLLVKEMRMTLTVIDNIVNLKDKKKEGNDFTGV